MKHISHLQSGPFTEGKPPIHRESYTQSIGVNGNHEIDHTSLSFDMSVDLYGKPFYENDDADYKRFLLIKTVRKVIDEKLTDSQREVVIMHYYGGYSFTEIAAAKGVDKSTISRLFKKAKETIKFYTDVFID